MHNPSAMNKKYDSSRVYKSIENLISEVGERKKRENLKENHSNTMPRSCW
jgi:hypothetical protein